MSLAKLAYAAPAAIALIVAGCAERTVFDRVPPPSEAVKTAKWPRLAQVTPPAATPDPATADAVLIELAAEAEEAREGLRRTAGPVQ